MLLITKNEKEYLLSRGFKWGNTIHSTHSNKTKYYMTESPDAIKALNEFRQKPN